MPVVVRGSPLLVALLLVAVTGCAPVPVPTSPSATVAPSPASPGPSEAGTPDPWLAAEVAQPSDVTSPQSQPAGVQCHPCHFRAENQFLGATGSPLGPIAVGVQQPPAQAIAFVATDDLHWIPLAGFSGATGTTAIAAVSSGARTVIVGLDHRGATAWASDGGPWTPAPRQPDLEVPDAAGAMTSVTALGQGFVAGGYLDDLATGRASAAVWRSRDGLAWRADPGAAVFAGGRIWGIAARGGTIVAVGTGGDPNYGPAAAWRWTGTAAWQRARIGPDAGGAMRAVTATPFGFVAVGLNGHDAGALAWTSPDGLDWTAAPDQPAFHFFDLAVRMQSVVSGPSGLVAGGWRSDAGKGSAVTWTSADGVSWQGPLWEASFSGGQITGLTVSGGAVVAVGRTGYPDWNQASAWARRLP